jgi:xylulokinase
MGGGARSPVWRSIFAAVFDRPLLVPEVVDGGALGAAMLAAVGTGLASGYADLGRRWTRIAYVEQPDPALVDCYARVYADFTRLEAALSPLFEKRP